MTCQGSINGCIIEIQKGAWRTGELSTLSCLFMSFMLQNYRIDVRPEIDLYIIVNVYNIQMFF